MRTPFCPPDYRGGAHPHAPAEALLRGCAARAVAAASAESQPAPRASGAARSAATAAALAPIAADAELLGVAARSSGAQVAWTLLCHFGSAADSAGWGGSPPAAYVSVHGSCHRTTCQYAAAADAASRLAGGGAPPSVRSWAARVAEVRSVASATAAPTATPTAAPTVSHTGFSYAHCYARCDARCYATVTPTTPAATTVTRSRPLMRLLLRPLPARRLRCCTCVGRQRAAQRGRHHRLVRAAAAAGRTRSLVLCPGAGCRRGIRWRVRPH